MSPYYLALERRASSALRRMVVCLILAVIATFACFWLSGQMFWQVVDGLFAVACWWLSGVFFCEATRFFELIERDRERRGELDLLN
jgi:membrane protein YdbS with pleckstrin-like domain